MIITKILGGLGNQLFQYAAGMALAAQNDSELKLDLSGFTDYKLRDFELNHFNTSFAVATDDEIRKYKATTSFERVKARLSRFAQKRFYKQPFFHFDASFFSLRSPVYVQGYFQSEKYFHPVHEQVKNELAFKEEFDPAITAFAKEIQARNSVAVHIRRGDYTDAESLRMHGILPKSYYQSAIGFMKERVGANPTFYIFSDDAESAKKAAIANAIIVSGNISKTHYEDFYLMQQCRHNIIANSSFSWWAAWLNNNPDKIVIAPKNWFGPTGPKDTQDLLPESWIRL